MGKFIDLTGQRFGRLVVTERAPSQAAQTRWACRCDCGAETVVHAQNLKRGFTVSCGCYRKEYEQAPTHITERHGHASGQRSGTYIVYTGMVQRTTDPKCQSWANYGGKGVRVCDRWLRGEGDLSGFECFLADMGERPAGLTIDRIDNDRGYEPGNCRWADRHTQAMNRSATRLSHEDVAQIRKTAASGQSHRGIAAAYGVHPKYVGQIVRGIRRAQG